MSRRLLTAIVLLLLAGAPAMLAQDVGRSLRWGREPFPRGGACFFKDAGFQGDYFCLRPGQMAGNMPPGFNDKISSVRLFGNSRVSIFNNSDFRGENITFRRDVPNLRSVPLRSTRSKNWGDRVSSIRIR
jgi:hypothetical protein